MPKSGGHSLGMAQSVDRYKCPLALLPIFKNSLRGGLTSQRNLVNDFAHI